MAAWMYVISCKGGRLPEAIAGGCLLLACICCCAQSSAQRTATPSWALQHLLGLNEGVAWAADGQRGLVRWGCDAGDSHVESSCTRRRSETTSFTCIQDSRRLSQAQIVHAQGTTLKMNSDALNTVAVLHSLHALLDRVSTLAQVRLA